MNKLLQALTLVILGLISQQSHSQLAPVSDNSRSEWVAQTVTAGARVRVTITKQKPKLRLAKTQRPVVRLALNDNDDDYYDETLEFQTGYRRPELVDQTADVQDISDEIKIRLLLARKRALEAYHATWS
jgi:hypothetical protein